MAYIVKPCEHGSHGGYQCDRCDRFPVGTLFTPPTPFNGSLNSSDDIGLCEGCYWAFVRAAWSWWGRELPADCGSFPFPPDPMEGD